MYKGADVGEGWFFSHDVRNHTSGEDRGMSFVRFITVAKGESLDWFGSGLCTRGRMWGKVGSSLMT